MAAGLSSALPPAVWRLCRYRIRRFLADICSARCSPALLRCPRGHRRRLVSHPRKPSGSSRKDSRQARFVAWLHHSIPWRCTMRKTAAVRSGPAAQGFARRSPADAGWPPPPKARLFGGDRPRGGAPVGVGHAGAPSLAYRLFALLGMLLLLAATLSVRSETARAAVGPHGGKLDSGAYEMKGVFSSGVLLFEHSAPASVLGQHPHAFLSLLLTKVAATVSAEAPHLDADRSLLGTPLLARPSARDGDSEASVDKSRFVSRGASGLLDQAKHAPIARMSGTEDDESMLAMRVAAFAGASIAVGFTVLSLYADRQKRTRRPTPRRKD